jgi:hypothetical protein
METESSNFNSKILVCWNQNKYARYLEKKGFRVACSFVEFQKEIERSTKKTEPNKGRNYTERKEFIDLIGFVVLCELNWTEPSNIEIDPIEIEMSQLSGIGLAKSMRAKHSLIAPVLFVSFISRSDIIDMNPSNEIVSTIGHYYLRLPSSPKQWGRIFIDGKVNKLEPMELMDISSHYCDPRNMMSEIKHDLLKYGDKANIPKNNRKDFLDRQITNAKKILKLDSHQCNRLNQIIDKDLVNDDIFIMTILDLSNTFEEFIKLPRGKSKDPYNLDEKGASATTKFNIVWVDDEWDIDMRLKKMKKKMEQGQFNVRDFRNASKAYTYIKEDNKNLIDVVIADLRLWDYEKSPKVHQHLQGYSLLKKCVSLYRTYTYIVVSGLDRKFLMNNHGFYPKKIVYKNGILEDQNNIDDFIAQLIHLCNKNRESFAKIVNAHKSFVKIYNWSRSTTKKDIIENQISDYCTKQLHIFKQNILESAKNNSKNGNCYPDLCDGGCPFLLNQVKLNVIQNLKSDLYYKYPNKFNPDNADHVEKIIDKFKARRIFFSIYMLIQDEFNCKASKRRQMAESFILFGKVIADSAGVIENSIELDKSLWIKTQPLNPTLEERLFLVRQF